MSSLLIFFCCLFFCKQIILQNNWSWWEPLLCHTFLSGLGAKLPLTLSLVCWRSRVQVQCGMFFRVTLFCLYYVILINTLFRNHFYILFFLTVNIFPRTKWLRTAEGQLYYSKVNVPEQWGWLHFEYKTSMAEIIMITQSNPIMYQVAAISGTVHLCLWAISLQLC